MPRPSLSPAEVKYVIKLRKTGHSLPEIHRLTNRGYGTVFRYIRNVQVHPRYRQILKEKQGGSKIRARQQWVVAAEKAKSLMPRIGTSEKLLILSMLYWGEGTKRELNIINSDSHLLRVFITCLEAVGVPKSELRITLRIYGDTNKEVAIRFWSRELQIPRNQILNVNVLQGKKDGKLPYGMCRVRVRRSTQHFKLIMSVINLIKSEV